MALINCPECGREISDRVTACPGCGYPLQQEQEEKVSTEIINEAYTAKLKSKKKPSLRLPLHLLL